MRDGQEAAFTALFLRHSKAVYNFAFRTTSSWNQAEEVTQSTFTTLWRRACDGRVDPLERESALPLLLWIARNEVLNIVRNRQRRLRLVRRVTDEPWTDTDNVSAWTAKEAGMARVNEVLGRLPEPQRAVVELVVFGELDLAECGHALNIPLGTVKSRLSRARKKLATTEIAALLSGGEPA
ncbi:RNA polymerase sigma factor [Granulicoccus sp. GXG6511]|uniref:RNA polymerase sigma factor n=1 Tax=Granulicoccus sp. GXG6511 TaxID=3381351 RepID=UPI003D7DF288